MATLKLIGVPDAAGLAATLLFRFFTFWLPMAPGLVLARHEAVTSPKESTACRPDESARRQLSCAIIVPPTRVCVRTALSLLNTGRSATAVGTRSLISATSGRR